MADARFRPLANSARTTQVLLNALPELCLLSAVAFKQLSSFPLSDLRMNQTAESSLSKVPEVTLVFWIIKIAATTLGETGGDTVTMTLNWGYLAGTLLFFVALVALVAAQIIAKKFHPSLYWATIIASTTFGTTMADFADRSLGIGYVAVHRFYCSASWRHSDFGTGRLAQYRSTPLAHQKWKCFIGPRSRF